MALASARGGVAVRPQLAGDLEQPVAGGVEHVTHPGQVAAGPAGALTDRPDQQRQPGAVPHDHLAAEQVERLDAVGALVDRVEPVVPVELLDRVFAGVAVTAVDLDGVVVGQQAPLRRPRLDDRGQHVQQQVALGRFVVEQLGRVEDQGQTALDVGLGRQQHPAHVRMPDDRHGRQRGVLAGHRPALQPLPRIGESVQISGVAEGHRAGADPDPRLVHHVEHVGQPVALLADQIAGGVLEGQAPRWWCPGSPSCG